MKPILFLFVVVLGFFACQDDDNTFSVTPSEEIIRSIKPLPGGAVIHYRLPVEADIFSLNLRYKDVHGVEMLKVGEYGGDSLVVNGFNEARKGVPARLTFVNRQGKESAPIEITFDTEDSAPYAFFEKAEVSSSWGGFRMIYKAPEQVNGMVHVFYLGTNPVTHEPDTILLKSSPIIKGGDTLSFSLKQERPENTVIVRTEDYRGYRVKQKVWKHVESYIVEKMNAKDLEFKDVRHLSIDNEVEFVGTQYLFDGDTKGEQRMESKKDGETFTFLAGPRAVGVPFIIDLKDGKIPAKVRIYGILYTGEWFSEDFYGENYLGSIWQGVCFNKLPCAVSVYGSNDEDPDASSWVKLGNFEQGPTIEYVDRWSERCYYSDFDTPKTLEALKETDPAYLEVVFPPAPTTYRYLKLIVDDVFDDTWAGSRYNNRDEYVTMHELEIYVKKDMK